MLSKSFPTLLTLGFALSHISTVFTFPAYGSLAGLSERELDAILPTLTSTKPGTTPGPLKYNGTKLIYDKDHLWNPTKPGDIRGPCPGLNTLASHGYLPRNGIATPAQIINAVQEGFNMENRAARFVTYAAFLVDGNLVTDLLSIGGKTKLTGPDSPGPASIAGLNTHAVFEGDASMTRADDFFGDNHSFNQTLFDQFVDFSKRFGGGLYNFTVAAELRHQRIKESIATNPKFDFTSPRFFTAYAESTFPVHFFVDGRNPVRALSMENATLFFRDMRFPFDFHRAAEPIGPDGIREVFAPYPIKAGKNINGINTYTPDPTSADFDTFCLLYTNFVTNTVGGLYPNPKGVLRTNLIINLKNLYGGLSPTANCTELFPYGKV
ncbi:aromatic peroxygenase precursor [Ephemerocybe angulata]|uniref:Aromatic peroxygenase n=1 Tax=Ephemerocybe angulata TaxID=980116 RepID=A0A8H6M7K1_9AGAR|nr:aromatic peroxygenase precursor [Tulosesus angulatus]